MQAKPLNGMIAMIRRYIAALFSVFLIVASGGLAAGCSPHAQEKVKEAGQAVGADVKDTAHDVVTDPALKQAGAEVKDAAHEAGASIKSAAADLGDATKDAASDAKADVHKATAPESDDKH